MPTAGVRSASARAARGGHIQRAALRRGRTVCLTSGPRLPRRLPIRPRGRIPEPAGGDPRSLRFLPISFRLSGSVVPTQGPDPVPVMPEYADSQLELAAVDRRIPPRPARRPKRGGGFEPHLAADICLRAPAQVRMFQEFAISARGAFGADAAAPTAGAATLMGRRCVKRAPRPSVFRHAPPPACVRSDRKIPAAPNDPRLRRGGARRTSRERRRLARIMPPRAASVGRHRRPRPALQRRGLRKRAGEGAGGPGTRNPGTGGVSSRWRTRGRNGRRPRCGGNDSSPCARAGWGLRRGRRP